MKHFLHVIQDHVLFLNIGAFTLSLMDVEQLLKIAVLLTTIVYTGLKIRRELRSTPTDKKK